MSNTKTINWILENKGINVRKGLTHTGVFHANDVFSAALLKVINPDIKITRSSEVPENFDGIIFDIGHGKFDRQANAEMRENGIKFAAFGLLWREFGTLFLSEDKVSMLDENLCQPIDAEDNGQARNPLSLAISDFVPNWDDDTTMDSAFEEAVKFATNVLCREIERLQSAEKAEKIVENFCHE